MCVFFPDNFSILCNSTLQLETSNTIHGGIVVFDSEPFLAGLGARGKTSCQLTLKSPHYSTMAIQFVPLYDVYTDTEVYIFDGVKTHGPLGYVFIYQNMHTEFRSNVNHIQITFEMEKQYYPSYSTMNILFYSFNETWSCSHSGFQCKNVLTPRCFEKNLANLLQSYQICPPKQDTPQGKSSITGVYIIISCLIILALAITFFFLNGRYKFCQRTSCGCDCGHCGTTDNELWNTSTSIPTSGNRHVRPVTHTQISTESVPVENPADSPPPNYSDLELNNQTVNTANGGLQPREVVFTSGHDENSEATPGEANSPSANNVTVEFNREISTTSTLPPSYSDVFKHHEQYNVQM